MVVCRFTSEATKSAKTFGTPRCQCSVRSALHNYRTIDDPTLERLLALYFEHFKRPLSSAGRVQAIWKTKEDFATNGVPQSLLNLFDGYNTLIQGQWNAAEVFEYRFARNTQEGLFGCFARLRQGLFFLGFAIESDTTLEANPELDGIWIKPDDLLEDHPHFLKKNG
jgi:hypothetical protein